MLVLTFNRDVRHVDGKLLLSGYGNFSSAIVQLFAKDQHLQKYSQ
jgi:hypothetical protein